MGIIIGAKPESNFDDPLGLLSDCHRRIEMFLQNLIGIVAQVQEAEDDEGVLQDDQRKTLEAALRYFREAAPRHTRDEEDSLFPKMRASNSAEAQAALAAIDALEADRDRADSSHVEVDRLGRKWLAEGRLAWQEVAAMRDLLESLRALYERHIAIEDAQIFPLADQVLDAPTIQAIGQEMADRRGIDLSKQPDLKPRRRTTKDA